MPVAGKSFYFWLGVSILALLLLPCGHINHGDGLARFAQTKALLRGSLSIPMDLAADPGGVGVLPGLLPGSDGRFYSKYGVGTSLAWTVPTALAMLAGEVHPLNVDLLAGFGISFVAPLATLLTGLSLRHVLRRLLGESAPVSAVILLYLFGCSTLAYANTAFCEPLVGLLLLWAMALPLINASLRSALWSGLAMSAVVVVKPDLVLLIACVLPLFGRQLKRLAAFGATAAVGAGLCLLLNLVCRGGAFRFSYGDETSRFGPPWEGLRGYFLGIDKNILLYNPALLLAILGGVLCRGRAPWHRLRWAVLAMWAVYIPFYAAWWAWDGGFCFGPRFFQSFIPPTLLLAALPLLKSPSRVRLLRNLSLATVVLIVPLQIVGLEVKNEEAIRVSLTTGRSQTLSHFQLLVLKVGRGIRSPELFHKSDFTHLAPGEEDTEIDNTHTRTFQYLNNWWLLGLSNHLRGVRGL